MPVSDLIRQLGIAEQTCLFALVFSVQPDLIPDRSRRQQATCQHEQCTAAPTPSLMIFLPLLKLRFEIPPSDVRRHLTVHLGITSDCRVVLSAFA